MIIKVFVNLMGGMRLTIATKAGNAAFDALDKNFHQLKIIQSYFLNIVVSIYMLNYPQEVTKQLVSGSDGKT